MGSDDFEIKPRKPAKAKTQKKPKQQEVSNNIHMVKTRNKMVGDILDMDLLDDTNLYRDQDEDLRG